MYYLTHNWEDKGVHTFPKGMTVNVIARLEFELNYDDFTIQHFNHYATRTLPNFVKWSTMLIMIFY